MDSEKTTPQPPIDRNEALGWLAELIRIAKQKGVNGRIKTPANERVRIDWIKTAIHGIGTYLSGLKDAQLDEIERRLGVLEHADNNDT